MTLKQYLICDPSLRMRVVISGIGSLPRAAAAIVKCVGTVYNDSVLCRVLGLYTNVAVLKDPDRQPCVD